MGEDARMLTKAEGDMAGRARQMVGGRREAQWRGRLARFGKERQTVAKFCATESVSVPSFYYWRTKLAPGSSGVRQPASEPVAEFIDAGEARVAAAKCRAAAETLLGADLQLSIELGGGLVLQILRR
jgi:hypothetical protein